MGSSSSIEWTEATWNPVTGCTKISEGCRHCYAERMARRLKAMGQPNYANGFEVTMHPHMLGIPLGWRRPRTVFVNSMSDLFHEDVTDAFIHEVFDIMREASWHRFQVLTKRSTRMLQMASEIDWPDNVWVGVTVESDRHLDRIDHLRLIPSIVRFLSMEPLLSGAKDLDLSNIDWVIVGGESGPGARPMNPDWVRDIRRQCEEQDVPFFFKQWGGVSKKKTGRILDGRTYDDMPRPADRLVR